MTYAINEHEDIQVIQVNNLLNEFDNNTILGDIRKRSSVHQYAVIVDLSELNFMNSVGLNFLLSMMSTANKTNTYLALANANEQIIKLLEMTKLRNMFTLTPTVEEALQYLERSR